jgi:hypothetical protein
MNKVSGLFYREMHGVRGFNDKIMSREGLYLLHRVCVTENKASSPFVFGRKTWQLTSIVSREVTSHIHRTNFYLISPKFPENTPFFPRGVQRGHLIHGPRVVAQIYSWKTNIPPSNGKRNT